MKVRTILGAAAAAAFVAFTAGQTTATAATGIEKTGVGFGGNFSPNPPKGGGGCINLIYPAPSVCDDKSPVINGHRYARPAP